MLTLMYNIKIYGRPGINLYKVLSPKLIKTNYTFSETINFWQQEFNFSYYWDRFIENSLEWEVDLFNNRNIVELYQDWVLIYTGWVLTVTDKEDKDWFRYEIKVSGLSGLLSKIVPTGAQSVSNPSTAIIDCINDINTKLWLNISTTKIQTYDNPYNWTMKNVKNCADVISQIMEKTKNWYFFINEKREAIFQPYTDWEHQVFIFWQDISIITLQKDTTLMVNKVYINRTYTTYDWAWKPTTISWNVTVLDQNSIDENWLLEKNIYLDNVVNTNAAATNYWEDYLSEQAEQQFNSIVLEKPKERSWLHPGDKITIRNTNATVKSDIIKKITYNRAGAFIQTKDYESLEQFLKPNL